MLYISDTKLLTKALGIWLILMTGIMILAVYGGAFTLTRAEVEVFTSLCWLFMLVLLARALPRGIWSICFIFFAAFSVFHAGLILTDSINAITDEDILYQISFWFDRPETLLAIHLVNLGMLGFSLGALLFSRHAKAPKTSTLDPGFNRRVFHLGGLILCLSLVAFFGVTGGTGALASYGAYLNLLSQVPSLGVFYAYLYFFIGLGLVLVAVAYRRGFSLIYFALFGVYALFAFKLGLRGEVMFPATVAACMLGRRGKVIKLPYLIMLVVVFLTLTGIVKNARVSGDYSQIDSFNPLNAVAEMGASLRPITAVIGWHRDGDALLLGGSYWAPIERQLALFVPGINRISVDEDPRLLNVVVQERVGPIGFSPIAEAYANFGRYGPPIIMFILGSLFAFLDNMQPSIRRDLMVGVMLTPLFIMIRNSFTYVPVQMVLGLILGLAVIYAASGSRSK
ncbi:O-antigen polysaccharide polymerase Wzy [Aliiglaciecola sp. CAU 1673]|uniref:O-antigen polysaccharide polymerase Wzy n=1 Tax=Aliiglaciecola sp. CAU 1673 TaxID=3032595 RepID=UPI0023D99596|nr:O-antigen polysaccharide polymerase Wzy [Aliiglaciecola sp. CAU 1673]MDF2179789.1 O-antigen polysaccharide polymerase Wzy [Aliiglaciecola sp. CAU 1673]